MSKAKKETMSEEFKGFKRKRAVTVPTKKVNVDEPIYITITELAIKEDKKNLDKETGEPKTLPVARAVDLETGELCEVVLGAALFGTLKETYGDEIAGKSFEVTKKNKKAGKDYYSYIVHEIDPEEAA